MDNLLTEPLFWGLAFIGIILTGISKSGFAGGAGVGAVPLLALIIPVPMAVALMLPLLILMDVKTVWYYRHTVDMTTLKKLLPAALIGIAIAGLSVSFLSTFWLQIALGSFSILFAVWQKLTPILGNLRIGAMLWGTISGITSTLLHAGGPPINIYLISRRLPKKVWLGTAGVLFAVMNLVKIIPYSANHLWSHELLILDLILFPIALFGIWLGKQVQERINELHFMLACRGLLLFSGIALLIKSFME